MSIRGSTVLHDYFMPFLGEIDRRIGRDARLELQQNYDFMSAWIHNLSTTQAIANALDALEIANHRERTILHAWMADDDGARQ